MNNNNLQLQLEKQYAKQNTIHTLKKALGEVSYLDSIADDIDSYLYRKHDYNYEVNGETRVREDLIEAHDKLKTLDMNKLVYSLFCHVWSKNQMPCTVQELAGMCINKLDGMSSMFRKLVAVEIILTAFSDCKLVEVNTTKGEAIFFKSKLPLIGDLDEEVSKQGYVLPSIVKPLRVKNNNEIGYRSFKSSLILGGKFHNLHQNYNHINRVNRVAYQYEERLEQITAPVFNMEAKVKKDGSWETKEDIVTRYRAFKQLHDSLPERMNIIREHTDSFYLGHAYDTRGRTYVKAYEFNYQGSGYLKAMVNLKHKEVIANEF